MTIECCDFCGDEMRSVMTERRAVLVVAGTIEAPAEFRIFPGMPGSAIQQQQHLMCAGCLAHLLPIAARIVREKQTERRPVRNGVIHGEIQSLFVNDVRLK